jgi:hypothetical protein
VNFKRPGASRDETDDEFASHEEPAEVIYSEPCSGVGLRFRDVPDAAKEVLEREFLNG